MQIRRWFVQLQRKGLRRHLNGIDVDAGRRCIKDGLNLGRPLDWSWSPSSGFGHTELVAVWVTTGNSAVQ